jgi:hypothetical protein
MRRPNISTRTKKIAFSAISGVVALGLSYFAFPEDLTIFRLFAFLGAMSGYAVGDLWAQTIATAGYRTIAILLTVFVAVSASFTYVFLIQVGSANRGTIVLLGILITATFFAIGGLFALTGVRPPDGGS